MTVPDVAVPGAGPVIPATMDGSSVEFCVAMSSRVTSHAGSIPITETSHRLRIKLVPCMLITMSVGSARQSGDGTGLTQSARIEYSQLSKCVSHHL